LQNQYLGEMVQVQEQGGSLASRWPTLESLTEEGPLSAEEPAGQPRTMEAQEEPVAGESPSAETGQKTTAVTEAVGFRPRKESHPAGQPQSTEEPAPLEQQIAPQKEEEGTAEVPPTEQTTEPPSGEPAWKIESRADLKPEDLGLSQDEFDRLMGQASTDWLEAQRAQRDAGLEVPREEPEGAETESPGPEAATRESAVEETERGPVRTEEEPSREEGVPAESAAGPPERPPTVSYDVTGGEAAAASPRAEVKPETGEEPKEAEEEPTKEAEPEVVGELDETTSPAEVLHGEARRFARLLVAEIKLYNEPQVEEGRRNGDLYSRLKTEIDRSREMYEKRVHPSVRASTDYFHMQLVQVLAQDNESLMGEDYPGPKVAENA
jgi:hypothetical protein